MPFRRRFCSASEGHFSFSQAVQMVRTAPVSVSMT